MKATFRITDKGHQILKSLAAEKPVLMHDDEVRGLMSKGMKIIMARGQCAWAFAPRKLAQLMMGAPFIAVMPAAADVATYLAQGGELIKVA